MSTYKRVDPIERKRHHSVATAKWWKTKPTEERSLMMKRVRAARTVKQRGMASKKQEERRADAKAAAALWRGHAEGLSGHDPDGYAHAILCAERFEAMLLLDVLEQ